MKRDNNFKKISIVIPAYNEEKTIAEIINRVKKTEIGLDKEIIVIDDGSTDGTRKILKNLADESLKIIFHEKNLGKGAALRSGFSQATGDIILVQDADLEYDPRDYPQLLEPILDGRAEVVYGSRFLGGPHRVLLFWHYMGNKFLTFLCNLCTNLNLTDMETGFKVFRREVLEKIRIKSNRFGFEPEITIKVGRLHCRVYEVPISYSGRDYSEGKKITWKDGVAAIFHILRFRFFD